MELRRFLPILILAVVVLMCAVIWFYPSIGDFRTENSAWNGAREFCDSFDADELSSLGDLPDNPENCVLVLVPYTVFSVDDLLCLETFVGGGGTLMLADDYGYGNSVLQHLGLDAGFSGEQLLDPIFNYRNSYFPRIIDITGEAFTTGVESIVLNYAGSVDVGAGGEVIARSSATSFLDLNDNGIRDDREPSGPLPVVAMYEYGSGLVFLLSDPSMIINRMLETGDNNAFIGNIMRYNSAEPSIMLDQSHLPSDNLNQAKGGLSALRDALATPAGITLTVIIVIALVLLPIWLRAKGGQNDGLDVKKRRGGKDTRRAFQGHRRQG